MDIWDMRKVARQAKDQLENADTIAGEIASFIVGRLRNVGGYTLAKLKKELKDFNAVTRQWK